MLNINERRNSWWWYYKPWGWLHWRWKPCRLLIQTLCREPQCPPLPRSDWGTAWRCDISGGDPSRPPAAWTWWHPGGRSSPRNRSRPVLQLEVSEVSEGLGGKYRTAHLETDSGCHPSFPGSGPQRRRSSRRRPQVPWEVDLRSDRLPLRPLSQPTWWGLLWSLDRSLALRPSARPRRPPGWGSGLAEPVAGSSPPQWGWWRRPWRCRPRCRSWWCRPWCPDHSSYSWCRTLRKWRHWWALRCRAGCRDHGKVGETEKKSKIFYFCVRCEMWDCGHCITPSSLRTRLMHWKVEKYFWSFPEFWVCINTLTVSNG